MSQDTLLEESKKLHRTGLSRYLFLAISYLQNWEVLQNELKKRNLTFRLALYAPDWPKPCILYFHDKKLEVLPLLEEDMEDKTKWDAKVTASAENFLEYFLGGHAIIPILLMKLKVKGMLKIMKVLWFINLSLKFFATHQTFTRATFGKLFT